MTLRCRDVLTDLKGLVVDHADLEPPFALLQIVQQMLQPIDQILPTCLLSLLENGRVGHGKIGRRHRREKLSGIKDDPLVLLSVTPINIVDNISDPLSTQQVGLLQVVEQQIVIPGLVPKPTIAL